MVGGWWLLAGGYRLVGVVGDEFHLALPGMHGLHSILHPADTTESRPARCQIFSIDNGLYRLRVSNTCMYVYVRTSSTGPRRRLALSSFSRHIKYQ